MRKQPILLTLTVAFLAIGGMGSECDNTESPTGDGGTGDGGTGTVSCRDDDSCEPDLYADSDQGTYDTSNYRPLLLRTSGGSLVAGVTDGELILVNAFAEDDPIQYWLLSEVEDTQFGPQLVDVFAGGDIFTNELYVFVDESGNLLDEQAPVIDVPPDSSDYSPLFRKYEVEVPTGYTVNALKSVAAIDNSAADDSTGILVNETDEVYIISIVDESVTLEAPSGGLTTDAPERLPYWFDGYQVYGYRVPGGKTDGSVEVTAIEGGLEPLLSDLYQMSDATGDPCGGQNVYNAKFGDAFYSPVASLHLLPRPPSGTTCDDVPTNADAILSDPTWDTANSQDIIIVAPQVP